MVVPTADGFRSRPGAKPPQRFGRIAPNRLRIKQVKGKNCGRNSDEEEEKSSRREESTTSEQGVVHSKRRQNETSPFAQTN
jgi:hypothetical protein